MHDPLDVRDLVHDELIQRRESGYDTEDLADAYAATDPDDTAALEEIYLGLTRTARHGTWAYDEPDDLPGILDALLPKEEPGQAANHSPAQLHDRILGGWLGRIAGCNLGKPVEDGDYWTTARIREYLTLAGAYPLEDYIPALEPMPTGYTLRDNWVNTTKGRVNGSDRDDDIDYSILALHLLEANGPELTPAHVAAAWLSYLPYLRVFTAERATYANLLRNVPVEAAGGTRNPYREWIGALIRGDVFGWTAPGQPRTAAIRAYGDAFLSHRANGIYGEMWSAALVSAAVTAATVREAFEQSLHHVPVGSRLAEALQHVRQLRSSGRTWDQAITSIKDRYGHYSWVHTVNNAAVIAAGLLWGNDDYTATVGLTVQGGWDTDSNGATAGSVAGTVLGAAALPPHFIEPLQNRTRSAVFGYDNSRISDLANRTLALALNPARVTN